MTTDNNPPICSPATHAPWLEILRQRCSGRLDRALVLRDQAGAHYLLGPRKLRRTEADEAARPAIPRLLDRYESAFHVRLDQRTAIRGVALPTSYGTESVDMRVQWWVHDPVRVVTSGVHSGWDVVRADLDRRLSEVEQAWSGTGRSLTAGDVLHHFSLSYRLDATGLTYHLADVHARQAEGDLRLGQDSVATPPYSWAANRREEYEFCLQAVRNGPVSLATLWLLRHPHEVSQVLDWSMRHQDLFREETNWQDEMAGLLGALTPEEQQELSELVRTRLIALGRRVPGPRPS
ncbi:MULTISPECIES: hypothetical protein [Streptomyces]|uniref:Transcriptional regulator n=1 Tax=Streptomyces luteosporeus TaxID=173856 RepID=A0ABP6G9S4_9ACTN